MEEIVYVCSPLKGDIKKNIANAKLYCRFVYEKGFIPYAPHLFFTQFMDDAKENERSDAIKMGLHMLKCATELWVFVDNGISFGMAREIEQAGRENMPVRYFINLEEVGSDTYEETLDPLAAVCQF